MCLYPQSPSGPEEEVYCQLNNLITVWGWEGACYTVAPAGKRVVHMKTFLLDGENEGKEVSLFIVPINVKGQIWLKKID